MIKIIVVSKFKNDYINEGFNEFVKRLGRFTRIDIIELKDEKIANDENLVIEKESDRIMDYLGLDYTILLDVEGKEMGSLEFADKIKKLTLDNANITFVIGGALGTSDKLKKRADLRFSISKMTFPHQLVRLIFIEQLYRAFAINNGIKYHK